MREQVEATERAERERAVVTLLRRPMLASDGDHAEEFALVKRHSAWLRSWFAHHAGWTLAVNAEIARLAKVPGSNGDATRGAVEPSSGTIFTRRRYVLFCLALTAIERGERQTTLGSVAEQVVGLVRAETRFAEAGVAFTLESRDERRDFVAVLRLLLELGVLRRVEGDESGYLRDGGGDVLYDVVRPALAALLVARRNPSLVAAQGPFEEKLCALVAEPLPDTPDGRNRTLRVRLARLLLDDPVVYDADLGQDERAYLESQRPFLMSELAAGTGLEREERREGIALVDRTGGATDTGLPEEGTEGHATLLLATWLAERLRTAAGEAVSEEAWIARTAALARENRKRWRKDATEPGAERVLAYDAVARLERLRLLRRTAEGLLPLAAIGRYALRDDDSRESG